MSFQGDPYRILGVPPGASLNEIRAAYRRMAKRYHPDTAGERALARFLAIQAAYERLVDGEGRLRKPGPGTERGAAAGRRPAEPWRADAARARASRDAWRARRAGTGRGNPASARGGPGATSGGSGDWARSGSEASGQPGSGGSPRAGAQEAAGPDARRAGRPGSTAGGSHRSRRATPGSTTYDDASDTARDPSWDGGAWYGPSLGTYWTINPREYADPRKHGPEYQARARRAGERVPGAGERASRPRPGQRTDARTRSADDASSADGTWTYAADADAAWATSDAGEDRRGSEAGAAHATWTSPSDATASGAPPDRPMAASPAEPILPDLESLARRISPRNLLELARRGWRWRALLAVVGWAPIGLALGSLLTSITGCAEFAASCPDPVPTLALVLQPLIPGVLVLAPPLAAVAAFGTLAALGASVPIAAVLAVGTGPDGRAGAPLLAVLVAAVYLVAIVGGMIALWRPTREP